MKISLILLIAMLVIGSAYGYQLLQRSQLSERQVSDYQAQVSQLLSQTEINSLARLEYQKQNDSLQSEVNTLRSQLRAVSSELQLTQQESPDRRALEQEIRQQLTAEFQRRSDNNATGSRINLVKQLAAMDSVERSEFMSMQNRYGGFLGSLDVSDERMDVIIGALGNLIAAENQVRMEVIQQVRLGEVAIEEVRDRMLGSLEQDNQLNQLSYVLTADELAAFSAYQDTQSRSRIAVLGAAAEGVQESRTFFVGTAADGSPLNAEIHILTIEPDN